MGYVERQARTLHDEKSHSIWIAFSYGWPYGVAGTPQLRTCVAKDCAAEPRGPELDPHPCSLTPVSSLTNRYTETTRSPGSHCPTCRTRCTPLACLVCFNISWLGGAKLRKNPTRQTKWRAHRVYQQYTTLMMPKDAHDKDAILILQGARKPRVNLNQENTK